MLAVHVVAASKWPGGQGSYTPTKQPGEWISRLLPLLDDLYTHSTYRLNSQTVFGGQLKKVFKLACRVCVYLLCCYDKNGKMANKTYVDCKALLNKAAPYFLKDMPKDEETLGAYKQNLINDYNAGDQFQEWFGRTKGM